MPAGTAGPHRFLALRELAASFGEHRSARRERELSDLAGTLGTTAIPLCRRELSAADPGRRTWAAHLLDHLAVAHRARVIAELHAIGADAAVIDDAKVAALALLGELGEQVTTSSFRDPAEVHRRSLAQLADLLTCAPDVALAAELLITQLPPDALVDFVDGLAQAAPARTRHLVDELLVRTDLDAEIRGELRRVGAPLALVAAAPLVETARGKPRVLALRHPSGRKVVIVGRRDPGDGRWRLLCLLLDGDGLLVEGLHRDGRDDDGGALARAIGDELVAPLLADGFAATTARPTSIRAQLGEAARRTVAAGGELPGAYFLGRDLLELGDVHQPAVLQPDLATTLLGRAVDLVAGGEPERARPLYEHYLTLAPDDAEAWAGLGLCLLAAGDLDGARGRLERAAELDPSWPIHTWNLAAIAHRQGRTAGCYLALRRFLAGAGTPTDADDAARVEQARRCVDEHERRVRLEHPGADAVRLAEASERVAATPLAARRPRRRATTPTPIKVTARRRSAPPKRP